MAGEGHGQAASSADHRPSLGSICASLGEANHRVHELEQFGGVGGSCQGLGFVALVELAQAGDGRQCRKTRDQAVCGLAEVFADGLREEALEGRSSRTRGIAPRFSAP